MTHAVFTNKYFLTSSTCVWRQQKFRGWNFKRQSVRFLSLRYHFYFNSISKNMFHSQNRTSTTGASGPLVARGPLLESLQLSSNMCETRFYCQVIINWYSLVLIVSKIVKKLRAFHSNSPKSFKVRKKQKVTRGERDLVWSRGEKNPDQIRDKDRLCCFLQLLVTPRCSGFRQIFRGKETRRNQKLWLEFFFLSFFFYPDAVSVGTRQNVRDPYPH